MKRKNELDEPQKDLHIILPESHHRTIKKRSVEAGVTISKYCTQLIFKGNVIARLSPTELKLLRDVANLSNNTNQIAKRLNSMDADKITVALAEDAIAKLHNILSEAQKSKIE